MDRNRNSNDNGPFNAHTGAAFGLIIGIVFGSMLLNVPSVAKADLPERLRSAVQRVVGNSPPAPAQLGS